MIEQKFSKHLISAMLLLSTNGMIMPVQGSNAHSTNTQRIAELKTKILQIARSASQKLKRQNEFDPLTRKALDPLVEELVSITPKRTAKEQLIASIGAWRNLWSDLPQTAAIASNIYQVIFPDGYYYNISEYETKPGRVYTSYLRGVYKIRKSDFQIMFTKAVRDDGFPGQGADLYRLAMKAELGVFDSKTDSENSRGLNLPGTLTTLFVDKDIRVVGGELKKNGVTDSLFVLIPQSVVNPL